MAKKKVIIDVGSRLTVGGQIDPRTMSSGFTDTKTGEVSTFTMNMDIVMTPTTGILVEILPRVEGEKLEDQEFLIVFDGDKPDTEPTKMRLKNVVSFDAEDALGLSNEALLTHHHPYIRKIGLTRAARAKSSTTTKEVVGTTEKV